MHYDQDMPVYDEAMDVEGQLKAKILALEAAVNIEKEEHAKSVASLGNEILRMDRLLQTKDEENRKWKSAWTAEAEVVAVYREQIAYLQNDNTNRMTTIKRQAEDGWIKQHEDDVAENVKICALNNDLRIKLKAIAEDRDALRADLSYWRGIAAERVAVDVENDRLKAELAETRKEIDRLREQMKWTFNAWECGCGWWNGSNLDECGLCGRKPSDTKAALARRRNSEYFIR
jgi:hypothetical protein